jgi:hypothetical protein
MAMAHLNNYIHFSVFSPLGQTIVHKRISSPFFSGSFLYDIDLDVSADGKTSLTGSIRNTITNLNQAFLLVLNSNNTVLSSFSLQPSYPGGMYYNQIKRNFLKTNSTIVIGETNSAGLGARDIFISKIDLQSGCCCDSNFSSTMTNDTGIISVTPNFTTASFTRSTLTSGFSSSCDLHIKALCFE